MEAYTVRPLEASDGDRDVIGQLLRHPEVYRQVVVEEQGTRKIVGTARLLIEQKLTRSLGKCGHVEDVAVHPDHQGLKLGQRMIESLVQIARLEKCYKVILDCAEKNTGFYERSGFQRKEVQMVGRDDVYQGFLVAYGCRRFSPFAVSAVHNGERTENLAYRVEDMMQPYFPLVHMMVDDQESKGEALNGPITFKEEHQLLDTGFGLSMGEMGGSSNANADSPNTDGSHTEGPSYIQTGISHIGNHLIDAEAQHAAPEGSSGEPVEYIQQHEVPMEGGALPGKPVNDKQGTKVRNSARLQKRSATEKKCKCCGTVNTPVWRWGGDAKDTLLCNACSLRIRRSNARPQRPKSPSERSQRKQTSTPSNTSDGHQSGQPVQQLSQEDVDALRQRLAGFMIQEKERLLGGVSLEPDLVWGASSWTPPDFGLKMPFMLSPQGLFPYDMPTFGVARDNAWQGDGFQKEYQSRPDHYLDQLHDQELASIPFGHNF